jgi:hypothetical protein
LKHIEYLLTPPAHTDESDSDGPRHLCFSTRRDRNAASFFAAGRIAADVSCW